MGVAYRYNGTVNKTIQILEEEPEGKAYAIDQCFSTDGPRPGTRPWHQLYRDLVL
jgi:hypothetical protein